MRRASRARSHAFAFLIVLAQVSAAGAQLVGTGSISGRLVDDASRLPIEGTLDLTNLGGGWVTRVTADVSGNYRFDGLAPGSYYLRAQSSGYVLEYFDGVSCSNFPRCTERYTPITVQAGQTTSNVDFDLVRTGSLSGTVTNRVAGVPLDGVLVRIYYADGSEISWAHAGPRGEFRIVLPPGTYYARSEGGYYGFHDEAYGGVPCERPFLDFQWCFAPAGAPIVVTSGSETTGIDFALAPLGGISGTVLRAGDGAPIEGAVVSLWDASGQRLTGVSYANFNSDRGWHNTTSARGTFMFRGLPDGQYFLTARYGPSGLAYGGLLCAPMWGAQLLSCDPTAGTPITIVDGEIKTGVDFNLDVDADIVGAIAPTVVDAVTGDPIPAWVTILSSDGLPVTGPDGGLKPGTYFAVAEADGFRGELYEDRPCSRHYRPGVPLCDPTQGTPIVTTLSQTTRVHFSLDPQPEGRISGTVTHESTGTPVQRVRIRIYDEYGGNVNAGRGETDESGRYVSGSLPVGRYFIIAEDRLSEHHLYGWGRCSPCDPLSGTAVSVSNNTTTPGIDFRLAEGGRVSGTVVDRDTSTPLAHVRIRFYDSNGRAAGVDTATDGAGQFTGPGLATGAYFAVAGGGKGYHDEYASRVYGGSSCAGDQCDPTSGVPILVTAGKTTEGVRFELDLGGRIAGTILDAELGWPTPDRWSWSTITFLDAACRPVNATALEDQYGLPPGRYRSIGLPQGSYFVKVTVHDEYVIPPGLRHDYIAQIYDGVDFVDFRNRYLGLDIDEAELCEKGTPVVVTAGEIADGIDFALHRGGVIEGKVTDASTGDPVYYVAVQFFDESGSLLGEVRTRQDGTFSTLDDWGALYGALPSGKYYVRTKSHQVWEAGYYDERYGGERCPETGPCDPTEGTAIVVEAPNRLNGIDLTLEKRFVAVSGRVKAGTTGMPGVSFSVTGRGTCSDTDAEGYFTCQLRYGWWGTITPEAGVEGRVYTPPSRSHSMLMTDLVGEDFEVAEEEEVEASGTEAPSSSSPATSMPGSGHGGSNSELETSDDSGSSGSVVSLREYVAEDAGEALPCGQGDCSSPGTGTEAQGWFVLGGGASLAVAPALFREKHCALLDTRGPDGPWSGPALVAGEPRVVSLENRCGLPENVSALAVTVTVIGATGDGSLLLYTNASDAHNTDEGGDEGTAPGTAVPYERMERLDVNALVYLHGASELVLEARQPPDTDTDGTAHVVLGITGYLPSSEPE